MNLRPVSILAGSMICLGTSGFAQQMAVKDPAMLQQMAAHSAAWDQAFDKNATDAVLGLYTDDAVEVTNQGPIVGREAIKKRYDELTKLFHISNHVGKVYHTFMIGTDGNAVWSDGEYSFTAQFKNEKPQKYKGYWSSISVKEDGVWKDRMQTWNVEPPPVSAAQSPADVSGKP